jgi:hemerythrin
MSEKKSELVTWSAEYSVGVKLIDDQHKGLLNLVNDMFNHVSGDEAEEDAYFASIIEETVRYIRVHFDTEEKMMLHTDCPGYEEHKNAHEAFVLTVTDYIKRSDEDNKFALGEFTMFLKDWILTHIAVMDMRYAAYFKQRDAQKADGKLSINQSDVYGG